MQAKGREVGQSFFPLLKFGIFGIIQFSAFSSGAVPVARKKFLIKQTNANKNIRRPKDEKNFPEVQVFPIVEESYPLPMTAYFSAYKGCCWG